MAIAVRVATATLCVGTLLGSLGCGQVALGVLLAVDDGGSHSKERTNLTPPVFRLASDPRFSGGTWDLALSDMDGDGDLDLVTADAWDSVNLLVNDGTGQFSQAAWFFSPRFDPHISVGDLDRDGDGDVVLDSTKILFTDGLQFVDSGQSIGTTSSITTLGDLDQDGDLDLIVPKPVPEVWANDGSGHFSNTGMVIGTSYPRAAAVGDVDGDGDLDYVSTSVDRPVDLWRNDGGFVFTYMGSVGGTGYRSALVLGDLDGDGDLDLVETAGGTRIWRNNGLGAFSETGQVLGNTALSLGLGDLDGDGDLDLVEGNYVGDRVWFNDGKGSFTDSGYTYASQQTQAQALGDLDGDGDLDLVVGLNDRYQVWLNVR